MCHSLNFYLISGLRYSKLHVDGNAICAIDSESEVQPLWEGYVFLRPSVRHSVHGWGPEVRPRGRQGSDQGVPSSWDVVKGRGVL